MYKKKKKKRQAEEEYEYKSKSGEKKVKPAKMIKKTCSSNCSKECNKKISEEERMSIYKNYWSLESIDLNRMYLSKLVDTGTKVRERKQKIMKSGKRRTRKMSRVYHLTKPNSGIRLRVCQAYFLSTFDISKKMIRSVVKKTDSSGTVKKDERGFATSPTTLPEERMKAVVDHILQFKTVESHYIRKDSSCQYLPEHVNVTEMHHIYIQWCAFND